MSIIKNKTAFVSYVKAAGPALDERFRVRMTNALTIFHREVTDRTPVWSGSAIANYRWSVGTMAYGYVTPIDNGPPGHTNTMPLGVEPRRGPNQAIADTSFAAVLASLSNPYQAFYLNNNDGDIMDLELGLIPNAGGLHSRSPNGMVFVSLEYVKMLLASGL
jgi:hypothetical protein